MHKALNTQLNSHQESISEHSVNNRMAGVSDRFLFLFLFLFCENIGFSHDPYRSSPRKSARAMTLRRKRKQESYATT